MSDEELVNLANKMIVATNRSVQLYSEGYEDLAQGELVGFIRGLAMSFIARAEVLKQQSD